MKKSASTPIKLNAEQTAAVGTNEGAWAIVSGPGSGKTTVLVERYKRLRQENPVNDILSLTFTKTAAKSMRDRAGEQESGSGRPCGFLTFHSFCLSVVTLEHNEFPYQLQPFPLATEGRAAKVLGEISRRFALDFRTLRSYISMQKREGRWATTAVSEAEARGAGQKAALAYKEYETKMREEGLMDFDSLLMETVLLFNRRSDILQRYQFKYVMVDEAQDTDQMQIKLVKAISGKHGNILFVGDSNQSIYQWRGSSSDLLTNFTEYFTSGQVRYLTTNYRATKKLTDFNYKIAPFPPPEPYYSPGQDGVDPKIRGHQSEFGEVQGAIEGINELYRGENGFLFDVVDKKTVHPSIAVLARTNKSLRVYEEALSTAGIRYHLLGKSGFFSQSEVKAILAYAAMVSTPNDNAFKVALLSPFHPSKYIKKKELVAGLADMKDRYGDNQTPSYYALCSTFETTQQQKNSIVEFLRFLSGLRKYSGMAASAAVGGIVNDLKAMDYYREEEESLDNDPVANLGELIKIAGRFDSVHLLLDHVRKVQGAAKVKKGIALATCHAAKGLEFDHVFLVNCQQGILPHSRGDVEEEKRIFFVGSSRAAKSLQISYSGQPSEFLTPFIKSPDADKELV